MYSKILFLIFQKKSRFVKMVSEEDLVNLLKLYSLWTNYKKYKMENDKMKNLNRRKKDRVINKTRNVYGYFKVTFLKMKELDPKQFFIHTRMNTLTFELLLSICTSSLQKISIREPVSPEARLAITLLYLSQGCSFQTLAWSWKLGKETVRQVVYDTCDVIWKVPTYVSEPNTTELCAIADDFYSIWNLPNCIGAIDGKHIAIKRPPNSVAEYFNYKKFYSVVLLACCDARYTFTYVDVGAYGSQSDGGIFQLSSFGRRVLQNNLPIPGSKLLPNSDKVLPHFFTADAAFPLHKNIMKPFPGENLPRQKEIYNKRICRARRLIENAFGILVSRWRILLTTLNMLPTNAEKIILACVALHNFLSLNAASQKTYRPQNFVDWEDENRILHEGMWRNEINTNLFSLAPNRSRHIYGGESATRIRNLLCSFVNNEGKILRN